MNIERNEIYNIMKNIINTKNEEVKNTVSGLFEKA